MPKLFTTPPVERPLFLQLRSHPGAPDALDLVIVDQDGADAKNGMVLSIRTDGTLETYQIVVPGFGTLEGAFQITSLEIGRAHV